MVRRMIPTLLLLAALPAFAQEPKPPERTPEEQKLAAEAGKLNQDGLQLYQRGRPAEAVVKLRHALEILQKLFPGAKFPDGHPALAGTFNNLGMVLESMGQAEQGLPSV